MDLSGHNHESLVKRNTKLEHFLKKSMSNGEYQSVRGYEACIIVSEKDNKTFKYVIISRDFLYLTENPPKYLEKVLWLGDLISVESINDFPNFLSGSERCNCQHIAIKYSTASSKNNYYSRSMTSGNLSSRLLSDRLTIDTHLSDCSSLSDDDIDSPVFKPKKSFNNNSNDFGKYSDISSKYNNNTNSLDAFQSSGLSANENSVFVMSSSNTVNANSVLVTSTLNSQHNHSYLFDTSPRSNVSRLNLRSYLPTEKVQSPVIITYPENFIRDRHNNNSSNSSILSLLCCCVKDIRSQSSKVTKFNFISPAKSKIDSMNSYKLNENEGNNKIATITNKFNETSFSTLNTLDDFSLMNSSNTNDFNRSICLNIYLLTLSSPMLMLIRSAWCNILLRSARDERHNDTVMHSSRDSQCIIDDFIKKLSSVQSVSKMHVQCSELQKAAIENMSIKKAFWKTPDAFHLILRVLQKTCQNTSKVGHKDEDVSLILKQAEFMVVLVKTISVMLRETEIYPSRVNVLTADRGKSMLDLLIILMSNICTSLRDESNLLNKSFDAKVQKVIMLWFTEASACIFELFYMTKQVSWMDKDNMCVTIEWVVNFLDDVGVTEKFIERLVGVVLDYITSKSINRPYEDVVTFYKQLFVLDIVLRNSDRMITLVKSLYLEEFKYFIHPSAVSKVLSLRCPINTHIIQLIADIKLKVVRGSLLHIM